MAAPLSPLREAIQKPMARHMVYDKVISMIASGILQLGDELPSERDLASMLSVSRATVRSAVQLLSDEGIVHVSQGARTRITGDDVKLGAQRIGVTNASSINGYSLEAVHAARLLVETAVVADAARHLSDADIVRLDESIHAQVAARNDPVRFLICDREFHLTIYYASTNKLLADFVVDLYTYMLDHRRIAMGRPGAIEKSLEDHKFIVRALRMRNPEAVSAAFADHIRRIHDTSRAVDDGQSAHAGSSAPAVGATQVWGK